MTPKLSAHAPVRVLDPPDLQIVDIECAEKLLTWAEGLAPLDEHAAALDGLATFYLGGASAAKDLPVSAIDCTDQQ